MTEQIGSRITSLKLLSLCRFLTHTGADGFLDVCPRIRRLLDWTISTTRALEWMKILNLENLKNDESSDLAAAF